MACINLYKMNFNKVDDFLDDLKSSNYLAKSNKKIDKDTCEFKFTFSMEFILFSIQNDFITSIDKLSYFLDAFL